MWVDDDVRPLPSVCVSVLSDGRVVKVGGANTRSMAMIANTLRVSDLSHQYFVCLPLVMHWGSFPLSVYILAMIVSKHIQPLTGWDFSH